MLKDRVDVSSVCLCGVLDWCIVCVGSGRVCMRCPGSGEGMCLVSGQQLSTLCCVLPLPGCSLERTELGNRTEKLVWGHEKVLRSFSMPQLALAWFLA